jgi:hypothetical protein
MERPLIQIDDLIREMTDEEYENYLELSKYAVSLTNDLLEPPNE